jgi:hypothetical protein
MTLLVAAAAAFVGDIWLIGMGAEELIPAPGKRQFVNKVRGRVGDDDANQMMLLSSDMLARQIGDALGSGSNADFYVPP